MLALFAAMLLVLATTATIVLTIMMNDMAAVALAYCSLVILVVLADLKWFTTYVGQPTTKQPNQPKNQTTQQPKWRV